MKLVLLGVLLAILSWVASAHEMRPSIASLSVDSQGVLQLELVTNMEAWLANVDPSLSDTNDSPNAAIYDRFRALDASELEVAILDKGRDFSRVIEIIVGDLTMDRVATNL